MLFLLLFRLHPTVAAAILFFPDRSFLFFIDDMIYRKYASPVTAPSHEKARKLWCACGFLFVAESVGFEPT